MGRSKGNGAGCLSNCCHCTAPVLHMCTLSGAKLRFFAICLRMSLTLIRFARTFRALRADWRSGYEGMTTRAYWQRTLAA